MLGRVRPMVLLRNDCALRGVSLFENIDCGVEGAESLNSDSESDSRRCWPGLARPKVGVEVANDEKLPLGVVGVVGVAGVLVKQERVLAVGVDGSCGREVGAATGSEGNSLLCASEGLARGSRAAKHHHHRTDGAGRRELGVGVKGTMALTGGAGRFSAVRLAVLGGTRDAFSFEVALPLLLAPLAEAVVLVTSTLLAPPFSGRAELMEGRASEMRQRDEGERGGRVAVDVAVTEAIWREGAIRYLRTVSDGIGSSAFHSFALLLTSTSTTSTPPIARHHGIQPLVSRRLLACWPIPDRAPSVQGGDQSKAQSASTAAVTVVEAGAEVPYTNAGVNKDGDVR